MISVKSPGSVFCWACCLSQASLCWKATSLNQDFCCSLQTNKQRKTSKRQQQNTSLYEPVIFKKLKKKQKTEASLVAFNDSCFLPMFLAKMLTPSYFLSWKAASLCLCLSLSLPASLPPSCLSPSSFSLPLCCFAFSVWVLLTKMPLFSAPLLPWWGGEGKLCAHPFGGRLPCLVVAIPDARSFLGHPPAHPLATAAWAGFFCFFIPHPLSFMLPGCSLASWGDWGACEVGQCFLASLLRAGPGATSTSEQWGRILQGPPESSSCTAGDPTTMHQPLGRQLRWLSPGDHLAWLHLLLENRPLS